MVIVIGKLLGAFLHIVPFAGGFLGGTVSAVFEGIQLIERGLVG